MFDDGGPKNTHMCVLRIDKAIAKIEGVRKIQNISNYHSVTYEKEEIRYKEYFNIGTGKLYNYSGELTLSFILHFPHFQILRLTDVNLVNGAVLVVPWTCSSVQESSMIHDSRKKSLKFQCPDVLCIMDFDSENDLFKHLDANSHEYIKTKTGMDKALLYYAQQKHLKNLVEGASVSNQSTAEYFIDDNSGFLNAFPKGWARKVRKKGRITVKQKAFIEDLFNWGASNKAKLSPEQMAERMREHMVDGAYYFRPEEFLLPNQIRSLISRINRQYMTPNSQTKLNNNDGIDEDMNAVNTVDSDDEQCHLVLEEEDVIAFEEYVDLQSDDEDFLGFD